ncbi:hypothetical protein [Sutcliffiella horikoshii]|uniref:hypothetical protein n=1 Tax=Sutcliffiella horikoshii TaxID=79883 RepID=UPI003CF25842
MEYSIKVATSDVKVTVADNNYSERELKIIEVLMLNIAAPANAHVTGENMAFNPLSREEKDIFHFQLAWQNSLDKEKYFELEETLERRFGVALKMSDIKDVNITFNVNSYQSN